MIIDIAGLTALAAAAIFVAMLVWNHAARRPEASSRNYLMALTAARLIDSILQSDQQVPILTEQQRDLAEDYLQRFYKGAK